MWRGVAFHMTSQQSNPGEDEDKFDLDVSAEPPREPVLEEDEEAHGADSPINGLNRKQEQAIIALLNEPTIPQAARAAGVGQRSLNRWLANPVFSRAYRNARREAFAHAVALTQRYAPVAVNTLAKIMADPTTPCHARVTAASTLLRFGREGIELDDLAGRIEALETSMQQNNGSGGEPARFARVA
jgi:hypothetical protein